jgi:hypothetical protein
MQNLRRNYIKTISLLIPLYSDNLISVLSPVLGQYGIQVGDFINKINKDTRLLNNDMIIKVQLNLFTNSLYTYTINLINYKLLLNGLPVLVNYTANDAYKFALLYSFIHTRLNPARLKINYLNFKGYLHSYNL